MKPVHGSVPDALMVFDGHCNFCSGQVRFLSRIDRAEILRFTPVRSGYGLHLAARYGIDADDPSTFVFFDQGRMFERSDAIVAILIRLPAPWRWLRVMRFVPKVWRDALYALIARNRYRLLGRRDTCMIPPPQMRARFIDRIPDET